MHALSESFAGPASSYCRLETVDNGALVADDGSLITVLRLEGSLKHVGVEEYAAIVTGLTEKLQSTLAKPGHILQVVFEYDPEGGRTRITELLEPSKRTARNLGLAIGPLMDKAKDILTHMLLFGTTGSGKTETLVSLSYNALATGSGLFYIDPKASPKLAVQIWQMARYLGRDDDFRVLNYGTSGKSKGKSPRRLSNTNNPFTFGSAEALTQLLVSLMPPSEGGNAIFADKAQALISGVMYALVDLRDKGLLKLSTSIRSDGMAPPA